MVTKDSIFPVKLYEIYSVYHNSILHGKDCETGKFAFEAELLMNLRVYKSSELVS